MSSESRPLRSPSPSKNVLVKIFSIEIAISSKNSPTPEWLMVPKMSLTRRLLIDKAFYQAAVRAAGGVAYA